MNERKFSSGVEKPSLTEEGERELGQAEIEELSQDMGDYVARLKERLKEIEAELKNSSLSPKERSDKESERAYLEEQIGGLGEFVADIESGEATSITIKPAKKE